MNTCGASPSKDTSCLSLFGTLVLALISFKHVSYYNNIPLDLKDRLVRCENWQTTPGGAGCSGDIFHDCSVNTHTIDQL